MEQTFDDKYYGIKEGKEKVGEIIAADEDKEVDEVDSKAEVNYEDNSNNAHDKDQEMNDSHENMQEQVQNEINEEDLIGTKTKKKNKRIDEDEIDDENEQEFYEDGEKLDVWYSCDGWFKAIKPGKFRFDCTL